MPIYEYKCSSCGHKKEVLQKLSDAPLTECLHCGEPTLKKLISAAGFQLKGSGWYATDFKGGSKSGKEKVDTTSGSDGKAGNESKTGADKKDKGEVKAKEDAKTDAPATSAGASLPSQ